MFTAVGNGDTGDGYGTIAAPFVAMPVEYGGYADALLELSGNLSTVLASNHPTPQNYYAYSGNIDQQGTPVVFTPLGCGTMLAGQGKSGELSLYDESSLGSGPVAQYQMSPSSAAGQFIGEPAYSPATGLVYSNVMTSAFAVVVRSGHGRRESGLRTSERRLACGLRQQCRSIALGACRECGRRRVRRRGQRRLGARC